MTSCTGGGTLELGPTVHGFGDDLTAEQKAQLQPDCVTTYQPRDSAVPAPPPSLSETRPTPRARHAERRRSHRLRLREDLGRTPRRLVQRLGLGAARRGHGSQPSGGRGLRPVRPDTGSDAHVYGVGPVRDRAVPVRAGSRRHVALPGLRDERQHRRRVFREIQPVVCSGGTTRTMGPMSSSIDPISGIGRNGRESSRSSSRPPSRSAPRSSRSRPWTMVRSGGFARS